MGQHSVTVVLSDDNFYKATSQIQSIEEIINIALAAYFQKKDLELPDVVLRKEFEDFKKDIILKVMRLETKNTAKISVENQEYVDQKKMSYRRDMKIDPIDDTSIDITF